MILEAFRVRLFIVVPFAFGLMLNGPA